MIEKTKEYDKFKFREDNREKIDQSHVIRLKESIEARNLLNLRPILVNEHMEVMDGQHRLLAAKMLGIDIYYQKEESLGSSEVILMNIAKAWGAGDYLNYYCKNGYIEYQNLKKFMEKHNISLRVALNICKGKSQKTYSEFKKGKFVFESEDIEKSLRVCWDTIECIKKANGFSEYTKSTRFWQALLKIVTHYKFEEEKWKHNVLRMVERFSPKAQVEDYCRLMMDVYNWRNNSRIDLFDKEGL